MLKWEFAKAFAQDVLAISLYGSAGFGALPQPWVSWGIVVTDLYNLVLDYIH